MSERNTTARTMHDLGLAAWFGGALMGAIGLNGATRDVSDPRERAGVASAGWARWTPVNAAAIGAHLLGGVILTFANLDRIRHQRGAGVNSAVKTVVTGAALGATAYSRVLGNKVSDAGFVPAESGVKPSAGTPAEVSKAQQRLRVLQWAIPAFTGVLVFLGAQQGEQQRQSPVTGGPVGESAMPAMPTVPTARVGGMARSFVRAAI